MSIKGFLRDERGVTAIEYGLIACLIFLVIVTAVGTLGPIAKKPFSDYHAKLTAEAPGL